MKFFVMRQISCDCVIVIRDPIVINTFTKNISEIITFTQNIMSIDTSKRQKNVRERVKSTTMYIVKS